MASWLIGVTIESMTGSPRGVAPGGSWPPPAGPPPTWPPTPPKQSRVPVIASLVIAVVAVAVAVGAWVRPAGANIQSPPEPANSAYNQAEIDDAKGQICDARDLVTRATQRAGSQTSDDPTVSFIIAVNVRLGAAVSADYISRVAAENPAAPQEIVDAVQDLATAYQETTLLHLSEATDEELDVVYERLDTAGSTVNEICGE